MLRGRQLLADALLLSLPQSLWLTSSSEELFLTGSIVEVRSYEEEDYGRAGRYRRGVAIALLAPCSPSARAPLVADVTDIMDGRR